MADNSSKLRPRKDPAPTDLAAKLVQLQRRNAADTRPRPKADRPAQPVLSKPPEVSREKPLPIIREKPPPRDEFARNMPVLSTSPRLFNPNVDPIPIRRTQEPETMSDMGSASPPKSHARQQQRPDPNSTSRRLFDPKRDPPVPIRFAVLTKPNGGANETPKPPPSHRSSGDYVSASSTSISSYPPSLGSSAFTLTSASSSSSSAPFNKDKEDPNSPVVSQLKRLYRHISHAERKLLDEKYDEYTDEPSRIVVQARDNSLPENTDRWNRLINEHKELAELMHNFMNLTLSPQVPVSFHGYPTSYNIPSRLWSNAFHRILEALRRASLSSPLALEHLSDLIYYAYAFYAGLLENPVLDPYRGGWLEALGDLARYRMAVAAHVASAPFGTRDGQSPQVMFAPADRASDARIDDSPSPSVGLAAALALDVEPERETWRRTARDWYAKGLKDTPGLGRLHHHLAIISREGESEELRAVYHFVKSMITSNPFTTSRESILAMFTPTAQTRRTQPDAKTADLFLLLHGMLFTHIQLDDFVATHARFIERLALEGAEEREWIMMAMVNLGAVLEYGRDKAVVRNAGLSTVLGGRMQTPADKRVTAVVSRTEELRIGDSTEEDKKMDVDELEEKKQPSEEGAPPYSSDALELSLAYNLALQLTFSMLSHALHHPMRKTNAFARPTLNPYITVVLTFLCTLAKTAPVLALLERAVPWDDLATFFNTIPRPIMGTELELGAKGLTHGCNALPEDWCLRGTEWMRRVYERGFWKTDTSAGEVDVLDAGEANVETDGIIEEDDEEQMPMSRQNETGRRWVRVFRAGVQLVRSVEGFDWDKTEKKWKVEGALRAKVERWKEIERKERADEEERRMRRGRWSDDMDVDEDEDVEAEAEDDDSDDEEDSEQVKELKARRRHFRSLLLAAQRGGSPPAARRRSSVRRKPTATRAPLQVVAGYSVLVVDTNILITSLNIFSSLVESLRWTIVVPLAVVTELDGLSSNDSQLGTAATTALSYLASHLRTHGASLKVQTSRGNYLSTLSVRSEQVDLSNELSWERNMDDLILRATVWQDEHWVDRSALLKPAQPGGENSITATVTAKVVLLSFDRNLRLKARARQLDAADEKDMAAILAAGT